MIEVLSLFEVRFLLYSFLAVLAFGGSLFLGSKLVANNSKKAQPKEDANPSLITASGGPIAILRIWSRKYRNHIRWILFVLLIVITGCFFLSFYRLIAQQPRIISTSPEKNSLAQSTENPIRIEFNVPIDTGKLSLNMFPELEGEWFFKRYFGTPYARVITFYPAQSLSPDQKQMFYFSYIANLLYPQSGTEDLLEFTTHGLPSVIRTEPEEGATDILTTSPVTLFTDTASDAVEWTVAVFPETNAEVSADTNGAVYISFPDNLHQGATYTVKLYRTPITYALPFREVLQKGEPELVKELVFTTVKAPLVREFTPKENGVLPNSPIRVVFEEAMNAESVEERFATEPNIGGTFSWNEAITECTFTPESALTKETTYTVTLKSGMESSLGGISETDSSYSFTTIGAVAVTGFNPGNNSGGIPVTAAISVTFNQDVDHISAESNFALSPATAGSFSWNGNTMTFIPTKQLSHTVTYTITVGADVASLYGINSRSSFTSRFTTVSDRVLLSVPLYYQQESFTCNIAAARMLLGYRGIQVSEGALKAAIGTNGSRGNGNPHKGWVDSYGVYWEPISRAISAYRANRVITNWTVAGVLSEVEKGNAVMIWGQNQWSTPDDISWTTSDGDYIYAISGMHSLVVKGFTGTKDNPTMIYLNDSWRGDRAVSLSTFQYIFSFFKTGLVID